MKTLHKYLVCGAVAVAMACCAPDTAWAQNNSTTYTVDPSFDSHELFKDLNGIGTMVIYDDGRILVGGGFETSGPGGSLLFWGLGMVWGDGSEYTQWGGGIAPSGSPQVLAYPDGFLAISIPGFARYASDGTPILTDGHNWCEYYWPDSPYNFASMWCAYVQEDDKVLLGGAVATDTTQPYLYRNLMRVLPDGTNDADFPAIEIEPNNQYSRIVKINKDSLGRWLVSGNFYSINGHETAFIARLNQDFSVDTTFVSPLIYMFTIPEPQVMLLDSQDRMWLSGRRILANDNPSDTVNVIRILQSGAVDTAFAPRHLREEYPSGVEDGSHTRLWGGLELEGSDRYMLYGKFNYFNDTLQPCITVVDDAGNIQYNYFQSDGATELIYGVGWPPYSTMPYVGAVKELPDGSLIVGGAFSKFMGTEHYNLIKLNRGTIGTADRSMTRPIQIYPNPAMDGFKVKIPGAQNAEIRVLDLSGREVYRAALHNDQTRISTKGFSPGMYLVHVKDDKGTAVRKIVVE